MSARSVAGCRRNRVAARAGALVLLALLLAPAGVVRARDRTDELAAAPLALTPEMRDWSEPVLRARVSDLARLRALHRALTTRGCLGLTEIPGPTGTAEEVFRTRRGNCVGFALLFTALAREAGIPVWFTALEESGPAVKHGDLRVETGHLAVAWGPAEHPLLFDFGRAGAPSDRDARRLTDREAAAVYYSNLGSERLIRGDVRGAIEPLTAAATLAPDWPQAWAHLAIALRRDSETRTPPASTADQVETAESGPGRSAPER